MVLVLFSTIVTSADVYVLSGYVFDSADNPLENVPVELGDEYWTIWFGDTTNADGYFEFIDVPQGYYRVYVNDVEPFLLGYTGAGIGDYPPMLDVTSDMQINFTLLKIELSFETNAFEYHNGDIIAINLTVTNNENFNLTDWGMGAELYFWNETREDWIDEYYYLVNISSEETESFLVYLQIPENNTYNNLYLEGFIWTDKEFKSSKGLLQGELWNWQEMEIFIGEKTKFNIPLSKGWNLVSVPLVLPNPILPAPFQSIEGSYSHGFAYIDEIWYDYYAGEAPSDKTIDPTISFWINMTNEDVLEVEGYELQDPIIYLYEGWNLIVWPSLEELTITNTDFENDIIYIYNGTWSSYIPQRAFNTLTTLKPGLGYWVKPKI